MPNAVAAVWGAVAPDLAAMGMHDHQRTAGEWLHLGNQRRPLMPAPHVPYEWQDHRGAWYATHTKTKSATFGSLCQNVSDTSFINMIHVHPSLPNSTHVYKFFLLETAILSQKYYFSQTFAMSTKKLSRAPLFHNMWEYLDIYTKKSMWIIYITRWSLLTFSGQFWHFHAETKGSPASCLPGNKT